MLLLYLETAQQSRDIQWTEHGMNVDSTAIGGQSCQVQTGKPAIVVLVQEVRYFLGEVAQDRMFAEPHLISVDDFLPPQSTPANVVVSTATEMVNDFTPATGSSPDIAADTKASALAIRLVKHTRFWPPPISSQGICNDGTILARFCLPVVIEEVLVTIVDARCK
jgi:hypothetical protein